MPSSETSYSSCVLERLAWRGWHTPSKTMKYWSHLVSRSAGVEVCMSAFNIASFPAQPSPLARPCKKSNPRPEIQAAQQCKRLMLHEVASSFPPSNAYPFPRLRFCAPSVRQLGCPHFATGWPSANESNKDEVDVFPLPFFLVSEFTPSEKSSSHNQTHDEQEVSCTTMASPLPTRRPTHLHWTR